MIKIFIPIKEKSQRVPNKNFRMFNGEPLYQHVIKKFLLPEPVNLQHNFEVHVNTDSDEVLEWCESQDNVFGYKRKEELIGHEVAVTDIIHDFINDNDFDDRDWLCQVHVTSPLLNPETISRAWPYIKGYDSIVGCDKIHNRFWRKDGNREMVPVNHNPDELIQTQDLEPLYLENSSFYVFNIGNFLKTKKRIGKNPHFHEVEFPQNLDIDTESDWDLVKKFEQ